MRTPLAFIFRVGQRSSMISAVRVQPGLWLLKENLVHACSEQDITTHRIKFWLWLRPCSWSSVSAGDRRCEEEKTPKACAGRSQESCCWQSISAVDNRFC